MNIDEACALLDKGNPYSESLATTLEYQHKRGVIVFERKGEGLAGVVQRLNDQRLYPIVDKKLGLVLGAEAHNYLRAQLYEYHYHTGKLEIEWPLVSTSEGMDRYMSEGHGYFISSMRPDVIIASRKYRPDGLDKDLFMMYRVEFFDEN